MILLCIKSSANPKAESKQFLAQVLEEHCKIENPLSKIEYNEHGKPIVDGAAFSVTHSDNALCIAVQCEQMGDSTQDYLVREIFTDSPAFSIGVDIEAIDNKIADRCQKIARAKFFESEQEILHKASTQQDYIETFCKMWTEKESYCKYTGIGLPDAIGFETTAPRNDISIFTDILTIDGKRYAISVCYNSIQEKSDTIIREKKNKSY